MAADWYQKQLELAKEYQLLDFQVLAHMGLADSRKLQGYSQTSSSDKSKSFQDAYYHIKQAWVINKDFSSEGLGVVEPNKLAELTISIVDELLKTSNL